jgi:cellulose biosynthesis protein BcsQ
MLYLYIAILQKYGTLFIEQFFIFRKDIYSDMEIITIGAQKGGAGKTPTSVNLAFALARRSNTRVLLVDTDPQASLSEYLLGIETYEQEITIYNAIGKYPETLTFFAPNHAHLP